MSRLPLDVHPEVADALHAGRPVVALESTLIAHGLPWPQNLQTARTAEEVIRAEHAIPATVAVWQGRFTVGLSGDQLETLASMPGVLKASRRDLAAVATQGRTAATTVAGTMTLAHQAGIRVFATGGLGGVHRGAETSWDVSADLGELARTPVAVVCAGAKSILDLPRTLELLEALGVPVIGFGTDHFPAFYVRDCGLPVQVRLDEARAVARLLGLHWTMNGGGVVVAQPPPAELALTAEELERALAQAEAEARAAAVRGSAVTPWLLRRLAEITQGRTLRVNQALVLANARLAARIAVEHLRVSACP